MRRAAFCAVLAIVAIFFSGCETNNSIDYARWNQTKNQKVNAYNASGEFGVSPSDQNFMDPDALDPKQDDVSLIKLIKAGAEEAEK